MLRFGGTITLNNLVVYIAYNFDKLLLGRVWGADALGLYGRAYQLIDVPTTNLHSAVGGVAFSALSRLQDDPVRLRSYFLKGYSLVISMTVPISLFGALFADDIVLVVLGPKWTDAAAIFRLADSDDLSVRHHQSYGLAAPIRRITPKKSKNCTCHRSSGHCRLSDRITLWSQWYCVRLFSSDAVVAGATCHVVPA